MIFNDMQERAMLNSSKIFNAIKFVWAVIILYLWLKISVWNIWENVNLLTWKYYDEVSPVDYEYNEDWTNEIWMHNVSDVEQNEKLDTYSDLDWENHEFELKYQTLCFSNFSFCMKVVFDWEFSSKDKFMYLASTIYVLNTISENIQIWWDIKTQLRKVKLSPEYWTTRGTADRTSVSIKLWAVKSYVEYLWLISHEIWHVVDLWVIQWYSSEKDPNYTEFWNRVFSVDDPSLSYYSLSWESESVRKSTAEKEDFCSGYGMTDPFEDFAECHNMYLNHNDIFKQWAKVNDVMKQKYNFFANLYKWKYMFWSSSDLSKYENNHSWRPWDSTKM